MQVSGQCYVGAGDAVAAARVLELFDLTDVQEDADVRVCHYAHFGIDEARELRERAQMRSFSARRVFVVSAATITSEAQNALLKTFEEPPADALFVLLVPAPHTLLPTLLSRMQWLDIKNTTDNSPIDAAQFLAANAAQRLLMLKVILDAEERDVAGAIAFLSDCEHSMAACLPRRAGEARSPLIEGIHAIYRARRYIADKGALMKALLEQMAFIIPRMV